VITRVSNQVFAEQLLLTRLLRPLRNDRPVKTTKASIELAIDRDKSNEDKTVRRREKNEVVDLDHLVASAPLCGVRSYPNHHRQRPILTLLVYLVNRLITELQNQPAGSQSKLRTGCDFKAFPTNQPISEPDQLHH